MLSGIWDMAREGWGPAPTCVPGGLTLGYSCPVLPYIPSHRQGVWWGEMEGGAGELGDPEPLGGGHQTSQGGQAPCWSPAAQPYARPPGEWSPGPVGVERALSSFSGLPGPCSSPTRRPGDTKQWVDRTGGERRGVGGSTAHGLPSPGVQMFLWGLEPQVLTSPSQPPTLSRAYIHLELDKSLWLLMVEGGYIAHSVAFPCPVWVATSSPHPCPLASCQGRGKSCWGPPNMGRAVGWGSGTREEAH